MVSPWQRTNAIYGCKLNVHDNKDEVEQKLSVAVTWTFSVAYMAIHVHFRMAEAHQSQPQFSSVQFGSVQFFETVPMFKEKYALNPFTAPACKMSGLKDARTRLQTVDLPVP